MQFRQQISELLLFGHLCTDFDGFVHVTQIISTCLLHVLLLILFSGSNDGFEPCFFRLPGERNENTVCIFVNERLKNGVNRRNIDAIGVERER